VKACLKSKNLLILVALLLVCLILSPYAMNGFWGDDALNSQTRFLLERIDIGLWDYSFAIFWEWLTLQGRPMAGFLHGYALFYIFSDLQSLRLAHCASVLINIGFFSWILFYLGFRWNIIIVWAVLFVGLFQISDALDPIAAFAFHYQFLAIQLFLSLFFLLKWAREGSTWYLIFSMIVWFWSMMYYEINVIILFIAVIFILRYRQHGIMGQNFLIVFDAAFLYFLLISYLRSRAVNLNYQGHNFGDITLFLMAYLKQLSSTLPLSHYLFKGYKAIPPSELMIIGLHSKLFWAILIIGTVFFYLTIKFVKEEWNSGQYKFDFFAIAICLILLPPILPAISARYQMEVDWGRSTLPIYFQYFGASLLLVWILSFFNFRNRLYIAALSVFLGLYLAFNTTMNRQIVLRLDAEYYRNPRELFINQLHEGLFQQVRDGDIVQISNAPHYVNANLIFEGCRKNVFVPSENHGQQPSSNARKFILLRNSSSGRFEIIKQHD